MVDLIKRNAKALVLLAVIVVAIVSDAVGLELGLDIEHYVVLLLANFGVWAVPNKQPVEPLGPVGDTTTPSTEL
jgi:hypothetical protein